MIDVLANILVAASCIVLGHSGDSCYQPAEASNTLPLTTTVTTARPHVANARMSTTPTLTGDAVDVVLSAQAAYAWDIASDTVLYEKNSRDQRPIASLNKLASTLLIADSMSLNDTIEIGPDAVAIQRRGANIQLPAGQHATVNDLLAASLIASANDAMVALASGLAGSEDAFITRLNTYLPARGITNTQLANATGLSGGEQYSTAEDVKQLLHQAYYHPQLAHYLAQPAGTLTTTEGTRRSYESTNQLLKTYVPIVAGKTGYTVEAGQNLAIITEGPSGQRIGAIILGSTDRFQDMKILVEWLWRNYTWPTP